MTCRIPGCDKPVFTQKSGLCQRHYRQQRAGRLEDRVPPAIGDPDGYGQYGILDIDEDKVLCHECGKWFRSLGGHLTQKHDMTAREYKITHGLHMGTALMSPDMVATTSEQAKARLGSQGWQRLESKRDPKAASHARDDDAWGAIARAKSADPASSVERLRNIPPRQVALRHCRVCSTPYRRKNGATCGDPLCLKISRYESSQHESMEDRAAMRRAGTSWQEIARAYGITTVAARTGYNRWIENQRDREKITRWKG